MISLSNETPLVAQFTRLTANSVDESSVRRFLLWPLSLQPGRFTLETDPIETNGGD